MSEQKLNAAADAQPQEVYSWYAQEDKEDQSSLRTSMVIAIVAHLLFLFATIPTLAVKETQEAPKKKYVRLAPTPKFQKPIPVQPERPKKRSRKVPIPDPTPEEVEIYVDNLVELEEPELEFEDPGLTLPTAPPEPEPTGPVRTGSGLTPPVRTHYVKPEYTEIARRARVQGTVIVEAIIDTDGNVRETKVLKGLSMGLSAEAVKAVQQWKFEQSTLNGKPVEVIYVLTVHYSLN